MRERCLWRGASGGGLTGRWVVGGSLALALVGVLGGGVTSAEAQGQPVIRFGIRVLEASDPEASAPATPSRRLRAITPDLSQAPEPEDARLAPIVPRLKKLFRYQDYRTLAKLRGEGPLGVRQRFSIPWNCSLEVTPERIEEQRVQMRVLIREGDQVGVRAGILALPGTPAIFGGPAQGDSALIVIIWIRPDAPPLPGQR